MSEQINSKQDPLLITLYQESRCKLQINYVISFVKIAYCKQYCTQQLHIIFK